MFEKKRYLKVIIISVLLTVFITGCAESEPSDVLSRKDVDEFLAEEDEDENSTDSSITGVTNADSVSDPASALTEGNDPDTDPQGVQDGALTDRELYIGSYTKEEYDALPLEEQDRLRDAERKKVTPPYEDDILPEYRELYDYNNAVIGYISIEGTVIDAPVLQTLDDYEYYLHRDIDGHKSEPGCIILDADSEIGIGNKTDGYLEGYEPSGVQLVHGHNMRNGTMFGSLLKFADANYADRHSFIRYDSIYENRMYEVICAFYSQIYPEDSDVFKYYNCNSFDSASDYEYWWSNISDLALYIRDVEHSYGDEYIVLSTCAYQTEDGRFAVVGVRKDMAEDE